MEIKQFFSPRMTLEEFADKYRLTMEIHERYAGPEIKSLARFYARFSDLDVFDGVCIIGTYGNGDTPEEAIEDYRKQLSGQRVMLNPWTEKKEFCVPVLEE